MNPQTFEKKYYEVQDNIKYRNYTTAMVVISAMTGKKHKDSNKLTPKQKANLDVLKAFCVIEEGRVGEANSLLNSFKTVFPSYDSKEPDQRKMLQILGNRLNQATWLREFYESLKDSKDKDDKSDYFTFVLYEHNFALAQKIAMQTFNENKNPRLLLTHFYLQYYNFLKESNSLFMEKVDRKKLKLLCMIMTKHQALFDADNEASMDSFKNFDLDPNVYCKQFAKLKGQMQFENESYGDLFEFLKTNKGSFIFDEYLEWVYAIFSKCDETGITEMNYNAVNAFLHYIETMCDISKFRANYEMVEKMMIKGFELHSAGHFNQDFERFYQEVSEDTNSIEKFIATTDEETISSDNKNTIIKKLLGIFLKNGTSTTVDKKHDQYRFYIKNNLLQSLLTVCLIAKANKGQSSDSSLVNKMVEDITIKYAEFNWKTNSVIEEIYKIFNNYFDSNSSIVTKITANIKFAYEKLQEKESTSSHEKCQLDVHITKLAFIQKDISQIDEKTLKDHIQKTFELFKKNYTNCYENLLSKPKIEKGERLVTDDFLQILQDLIRILNMKIADPAEKVQWDRFAYFQDYISQTSPYNFDLCVRNFSRNNQYCLNQKNLDLMQTFDIKGNQFDTLGYLFYNLPIDFPYYETIEKQILPANLYYFEAAKDSKQTIQYCYKYGNLLAIKEAYNYDKIVETSLTKILLDNAKLENWLNKLAKNWNTDVMENCSYIIKATKDKFDQQVSCNFELKLPQLMDFLTFDTTYVEFLCPFTDYNYTKSIVLYNKVVFQLLSNDYVKFESDLDDDINQLWKTFNEIDPKTIFTADKFNIFRRYANPLKPEQLKKTTDDNRLNGVGNLLIKKDRVLLQRMLFSAVSLVATLTSDCKDLEQLVSYAAKFNESLKIIQSELDLNLESLQIENMPYKKSMSFVTNYLYKFSTIVHILDKNAAKLKENLTKLEKANKEVDFTECRTFVLQTKKIKKNLVADFAKCVSKIRSIETEFQNKITANEKFKELPECLQSNLEPYNEKVLHYESNFRNELKDMFIELRVYLELHSKTQK